MSWMSTYGQKRAQNKRLIQQQLDAAGLNTVRVAERAGVSPQAVSATLNGHLHSTKVLDVLRGLGIAEKLLCDPHRHQRTA